MDSIARMMRPTPEIPAWLNPALVDTALSDEIRACANLAEELLPAMRALTVRSAAAFRSVSERLEGLKLPDDVHEGYRKAIGADGLYDLLFEVDELAAHARGDS